MELEQVNNNDDIPQNKLHLQVINSELPLKEIQHKQVLDEFWTVS